MRLATLAVLGFCTFAPAVGRAQSIDALSIAAGTHARLSGRTKSKAYLTVVSAEQDSLRFHVEGDSGLRVLSWHAIDEMDVSGGLHRHIGRGAAVGFVVGFLGGAIVMEYLNTHMFPTLSTDSQKSKSVVNGGVAFGAIFGFVFAMAGAVPKETWIPVTLPRSPQ